MVRKKGGGFEGVGYTGVESFGVRPYQRYLPISPTGSIRLLTTIHSYNIWHNRERRRRWDATAVALRVELYSKQLCKRFASPRGHGAPIATAYNTVFFWPSGHG